MNMSIDICIPVYKPDEKFARLLKGLKTQTVKPANIIIMYTRSSAGDHLDPGLIELGMEAGEFKVYELDKADFDHGGTRAAAFMHSDADIMVMMTMDAIPYDDRLIEELTVPFADMSVAATYARQMPAESSSLAERFTRGFNYPETSRVKGREDLEELGIKTFFCSNVCAAYRRDVYDELGGFIKRTIFNEDMIFAHKVIMSGYKICYSAAAKVIHTHEYSAMQQFHRNFDLAVSQAMHPEVFEGISSESEGVKYIKEAHRYFKNEHRGYLIIPFVYGCCFKYLGYLLGRRYDKLPKWFVNMCAMNKGFFRQEKTDG